MTTTHDSKASRIHTEYTKSNALGQPVRSTAMKTDPSQPVPHYEPRNVTVRRELFRFADANQIACQGDHHTHHGPSLEEVWKWTFTGVSIPLWELLRLFHKLYPSRPITISAHMAEGGFEVVVIDAPALADPKGDR